jgi:hypothetical protein
MYVCIRGGLLQPLHLDPQWSIATTPKNYVRMTSSHQQILSKAGYRLCAANSSICLLCSCPASKCGSRVRLLMDAVPQTQDRLKWNSTAYWIPFAAGQRTAPIWLDTRQVRARQNDIDFARQSNKHCLARQPRATDNRLNPLKTEFLLNNIYEFNSYLTGNTIPLQRPAG